MTDKIIDPLLEIIDSVTVERAKPLDFAFTFTRQLEVVRATLDDKEVDIDITPDADEMTRLQIDLTARIKDGLLVVSFHHDRLQGELVLKPIVQSNLVHCTKCGGCNVEYQTWIDPNTDTVVGNDGRTWQDMKDAALSWCADCDDHTLLADN